MTTADVTYFRSVLEAGRAAERTGSSRKVVGVFCNFVPEELIVAAGAIPVRLCAGSDEAANASEDIFPRDICPVSRASLGLLRREAFGRLDLAVVPLVCDAKTKLAAAAAQFVPVHLMTVPRSKTDAGAEKLWSEQVQALKRRLENLTGSTIGWRELQQAIKLLDRRNLALRRLLELRRRDDPPLSGLDLLTIVGASFEDGPASWTEQVERLCAELEQTGPCHPERSEGSRRPRILLAGAPLIYPNFKLAEVIEQAGATIVADDLCSCTQRLYNRVVPEEWTVKAMMRALAEATLLPSICPCFADSADRLTRLLELVRGFRVDGVIHHTLRLCCLFDADSHQVHRALRERGIPFLNLHTDYSREDTAQLRTRVEAFLEVIAAGRMVSAPPG